MNTEKLDWRRLEKALTVEAETGFNNIQGKQYLFNDFLSISLSNPPEILPKFFVRKCQETSRQFARYSEMNLEERQDLIGKTREFLAELKSVCEAAERAVKKNEERIKEEPNQAKVNSTPISTIASSSPTFSSNSYLDRELTYIKGVGPRNR
ncbi:MAG: DNA helicase RecG, partial [Okeania sp. SIO2H7]|nr:DNA helicase RecG [Okeania sp. SIO2H7]